MRGKRREIRGLRGGDSVFTLYLCVNRDKKYFSDICSGHFFYTPHKDGLSTVDASDVGKYLNDPGSFEEPRARQMIRTYLDEYFRLNTFEISFPVLRDDSLAPEGRTGIIISTLFDHRLTERIAEAGWYQAFKAHAEDAIISVLENSIFPGLSADIEDRFSSTPLSIEAHTANMHGAITGWAFTNPRIPVTHKLTKMFSSTETPLPHIHQAGQWSYSPAGLPISVLTGKLAADKILK
ncbi:MAG: hypothetical protein U5N26_09780 [Candidatus Marinimicrobia bacterium]|nr:hypothetical protein [Candidatus Neomarinimicrobiota bacterium]